jgi:hypothetical protein
MRTFFLILSCLFFVSCAGRFDHRAQYVYHDDGTAKPKVALIPVFDRSGAETSWNLSDELTEMIENRMDQTGQFYITQDFETLGKVLMNQADLNPFFEEMNWVKESNSATEFLIFVELVEHKVTPSNSKGIFSLTMLQSYTLDMSIRIRVIDIRGQSPKVILQEITQQSFHIPWRFTSFDYKKSGWSKTTFYLSPMGSAHAQMVKRITKQIHDYILLAKSN